MEEDNKEIKVGDIVKFKEDTYAINDVGRKENLYGALGMVIEMDYSIPGECFYTCAFSKDGKVVIMPHEYGTYTFKNGVYTEMGRSTKDGDMVLVDKTTFKGRWKNRHDVWKKTALPDKVVKHIVNCCKSKETPADIQQLIKKNMFN